MPQPDTLVDEPVSSGRRADRGAGVDKGATESDPEWIAALRARDRAAFTQLVERYHAGMMSLARSLVGDAAADVVQDSWISAFRALPDFRGHSSLKTWLLRITANRAISHLRSRGVAAGESAPDGAPLDQRFDESGRWGQPPFPWSLDTPDALLASAELRETIARTVDALPPLQRSVLRLREAEGLDRDEICKILDISTSNLHVLLHRARVRLWRAIEAYQRSGDDAQV